MKDRSVKDYGSDWEANAREDAFYSILTSHDKRAGWDEASFFAAGEEETSRIFAFMERAGIHFPRHSRFLDFGCGVGRNSRALMKKFDAGIGVDISPSMISLAKKYAAADVRIAEYVVNQVPDISFVQTGSVDFVYSHIVLQHIPASAQMRYIAEFLRVLAPGGVAAFQVITGWHARNLARATKRVLTPYVLEIYRLLSSSMRMTMNCVSGEKILRLCDEPHPTVVVQAPYSNSTDPNHGGNVEFMTKEVAVLRIRNHATDSDFLSQFFFVKRMEA